MWIYATIPFCIQGIAIAIDEGYFHYKRGLPKWERIGHPLDTFSLLICMLMIITVPFTVDALKIYSVLAIISCLMVTKDEFVHKHHCNGSENWLHALLFVLHPITLTMAGLMWPITSGVEVPEWMSFWLNDPQALLAFLYLQTTLIFIFFVYQVIFWNVIWRNKPVLKQ